MEAQQDPKRYYEDKSNSLVQIKLNQNNWGSSKYVKNQTAYS